MSDSQVIARKFRPKSFDQVIGQEAITRTLKNAITTNRIHHAYLFTGARGVGKTTTARILAKALNCINGPTIEPCDNCASCLEIAKSGSIDVLEIDAASNTGVDNVREVIIQTIQIAPARDRYKIFIIDEVHQLSAPAFNALLKTLEEPPPRVAFIMATTELHKVPETILSRCQVFEFRTISVKKIIEQLRHIAEAEALKVSEAALFAIARAGNGSMRDAESAFDQVISFAGKTIEEADVSAALGLVDLESLNATLRAIAGEDSQGILRLVEEVVSRGYDLRNFCRELMVHTRALLVTKIAGFDPELLQIPRGEGEALVRLSESFSEQDLLRFFSILTKTEQDIRLSTQPRFHLEIGLMKLVHARRLFLLEEALQRLEDLETRAGGTPLGAVERPQSGPVAARGSDGPPGFQSHGDARADAKAPQRASQVAPRALPPPRPAAPAAPAKTDKPDFDAGRGEEPPSSSSTRVKPVAPATEKESRPRTGRATSHPPEEPPMLLDEPYDEGPVLPPPAAKEKEQAVGGEAAVQKIKAALEARKKMILVMTLDKAESIKIDGGFLRVVFAPSESSYKSQVESSRKVITEACLEVVGRPLSVSVTIGGPGGAEPSPKQDEARARDETSAHPNVKAVVDKFQGVLEVIKPEG
jgi:DNA polymerase-3 subunit gamma/tau